MQMNIAQALLHMRLLSGNENNKEYFQHFFDPKHLQTPEGLADGVYGSFNELIPYFEKLQNQMCGIYVTMNVTDGKGRKEENIIKFRAVFADYDNMAEPNWPLQPHFKTARDATHGHAIWFVNNIDDAEQFKNLQLRIAMNCKTDMQVFDICRVLRVAGTVHWKDHEAPSMYHVVEDYVQVVGVDHAYTMADIVQAFVLTPQEENIHKKLLIEQKGLHEGEGFKENKFYTDECIHWLKNFANPAIEGQGSNEVYKVAGYCKDRAVPIEIAKEIMWEHYNPRCLPVWQDYERWQFEKYIENSYRHGKSVAGCKTAIGKFMAAPTLVEPIGGWEANDKMHEPIEVPTNEIAAELRASHRISKQEALNLQISINAKTPHYTLAKLFDGLGYNGCEIYRHKKDFYIYGERAYEVQDEDCIKSEIQNMLAKFDPPDSQTSGVLKCFKDFVNLAKLRNGFFMSNPNKDCSNLIPFKNHIVDIDTKETFPHSSDFFTLASINYNYNPHAPEPELWNKTLGEIFSHDQDTMRAMEEWIGYCMTTETKYEKLAIFAGLPRSGKGTICTVIEELIGKDNISSPQLANIIQDPILAKITSMKVALIPEAHNVPIQRRDGVVSVLKAITGNDSLTFDVKFKDARTVSPTCRFILSTNNVPEFVDASGALIARTLAFPFRNSFEHKTDPNLKKKLKLEVEGIAQRCIRAYEQVKARGFFTESEMMIEEKTEMKEDMNPLSSFFTRYCDFVLDAKTSTKELHDYFVLNERLSHNKNPITEIKFSRLLKASNVGIKSIRMSGTGGVRVRGWQGIQIKDEIINGATNNVVDFQDRSSL